MFRDIIITDDSVLRTTKFAFNYTDLHGDIQTVNATTKIAYVAALQEYAVFVQSIFIGTASTFDEAETNASHARQILNLYSTADLLDMPNTRKYATIMLDYVCYQDYAEHYEAVKRALTHKLFDGIVSNYPQGFIA